MDGSSSQSLLSRPTDNGAMSMEGAKEPKKKEKKNRLRPAGPPTKADPPGDFQAGSDKGRLSCFPIQGPGGGAPVRMWVQPVPLIGSGVGRRATAATGLGVERAEPTTAVVHVSLRSGVWIFGYARWLRCWPGLTGRPRVMPASCRCSSVKSGLACKAGPRWTSSCDTSTARGWASDLSAPPGSYLAVPLALPLAWKMVHEGRLDATILHHCTWKWAPRQGGHRGRTLPRGREVAGHPSVSPRCGS